MKKTVAIAISLIALLALSAVYTPAQGPGRGFRHGPGGGHVFDQLDLTDQQQSAIKEILAAEKAANEPIFQELASVRKELNEATAEGKFDEAQVQALATRHGQAMAQLMVERERVKSQIYAVLTPEQREKAEQLRNRRGPRRRGQAPPPGQ